MSLSGNGGAAHVAAASRARGPAMSTIWIDGGRFGISSDWIGGRCAPTQTDDADAADRDPQAEHAAPQ